ATTVLKFVDILFFCFFFQAEDGIRDKLVTGVQTCALPILQNAAYDHAYYHGSQHFVQWVIQQLEEQLGAQTFLTGGFNVRTTIRSEERRVGKECRCRVWGSG